MLSSFNANYLTKLVRNGVLKNTDPLHKGNWGHRLDYADLPADTSCKLLFSLWPIE